MRQSSTNKNNLRPKIAVRNRYNNNAPVAARRQGMFANAQRQGGGGGDGDGDGDDDPSNNNHYSTVVGYERAPTAASKVGNSLKGLLVGPVLIVGACLLLWHNEGWAIQTHRSLHEALDAYVELGGAAASSPFSSSKEQQYNERLVHITDKLTVDAPLTDPQFDLRRPDAIALVRHVEIFQWVEHITKQRRKLPNGETEVRENVQYKKQWVAQPIDSSGFRHVRGHDNIGALPFPSATFRASEVHLGTHHECTLSRSLTEQLNYSSEVPMSSKVFKTLPEGAETKGNVIYFSIRGGGGGGDGTSLQVLDSSRDAIEEQTVRMDGEEKVLYVIKATGDTYSTKQRALEAAAATDESTASTVHHQQQQLQNYNNAPEIGDVRVTFRETKCTTVSVLAKLTSSGMLAKWQSSQGPGYDVGLVALGTVSAHEMIAKAQDANDVQTWLFRGGGWLLNVLGFSLITQIVATTANITLNWIPLFGPMANSIIGLGVAVANLILGSCLTTTVAAIAWVVYRPVVGISVLVGSLGLFVLASRLGGGIGANAMGKNVKQM